MHGFSEVHGREGSGGAARRPPIDGLPVAMIADALAIDEAAVARAQDDDSDRGGSTGRLGTEMPRFGRRSGLHASPPENSWRRDRRAPSPLPRTCRSDLARAPCSARLRIVPIQDPTFAVENDKLILLQEVGTIDPADPLGTDHRISLHDGARRKGCPPAVRSPPSGPSTSTVPSSFVVPFHVPLQLLKEPLPLFVAQPGSVVLLSFQQSPPRSRLPQFQFHLRAGVLLDLPQGPQGAVGRPSVLLGDDVGGGKRRTAMGVGGFEREPSASSSGAVVLARYTLQSQRSAT